MTDIHLVQGENGIKFMSGGNQTKEFIIKNDRIVGIRMESKLPYFEAIMK
ncbi:MAG: hypothetical protein GY909_06790 [Oligoflexia bacterium]|nr:hypothetical protein [Oligoflexia bacterium]